MSNPIYMRKKVVTLLIIVLLALTAVVDAKGFGKLRKERYSETTALNETTVTWNDCPKGLVYDPYPGECGNYIDTDGDGYCDHSEPPPWERLSTSGQSFNSAVSNPSKLERYNVIQLIALGVLLVILAEVVERKFSKRFARYWWNVILLIIAVPSALIGLLLLFLDFRTIRDYDLLFWHVEFSIVASVLCLHHLLKRYRHFFKVPKT